MGRVSVDRQKLIPQVRKVPTETPIIPAVFTPGRVGVDPRDLEKEAEVVYSIEEAFEAFKPAFSLKKEIDGTEFRADLSFAEGLHTFDPDEIRRKKPGQRNDIADVNARMEVLQEVRDRFASPRVRRAWEDPAQRALILKALREFETQMQSIFREE